MRTPVAAAVLVLGLAGLTACSEAAPTAEDPAPSGSRSEEPSEPASEEPASEGPSPTEPESPRGTESPGGDTVTVPVYFVGDTPQGPALFREFRKVGADNPLEEAAALLTAGDALDPDYRTLFPGGAFTAVEDDGTHLVASVPDGRWKTPAEGMSRREARLAVQSLVYTLQGVVGERKRILVSLRGSSDWVPLFGHFHSNGFRAAPQPEVLAHVNVTIPGQGARVSGTFTASGVANSFEATVPWEVRRGGAHGEVVVRGFTTAEGWGDRNYPWRARVDVSGLAPGDYTFVAMTDDPSGGEGGGPHVDTKAITVD